MGRQHSLSFCIATLGAAVFASLLHSSLALWLDPVERLAWLVSEPIKIKLRKVEVKADGHARSASGGS